MKVIDINIEDLKPYENNPRINDEAVKYVAESIEEFGFKVPIVVDQDYVIVAGHTRWRAAKELGLATVPCVIADDLTEDQLRAFRLADNKVSEYSTWDIEKLEIEMSELEIDMEPFGFIVEPEPVAKENEPKETEPTESTRKTHVCPKCGHEWEG